MGGLDCIPSYFEWEAVATGTPARFYTDLCMRDAPNYSRPRVGWLVEAPPYAQCHYDWAAAHEHEFDIILTHCLKYVERGGPWTWYPHGGSHVHPDEWGAREKLGMVSFLASNKMDAPGHKLRNEIYQEFKGRMDCFGSIVDGVIHDKLTALAPYRYSVVVESERLAGAFSDHLLDALALGTIPIYWGCPDHGRYFEESGVIPFENADELSAILDSLSERDYELRLPAARRNLETARRYRVPEDWLWGHYKFLFNGVENDC